MRVANTYANWEFDETKAYDKSGKKYVKAKCKCGRCTNGIYVTRIENGHPVPHPAYGGVCLACGGDGYITKEIRLYTDKEFSAMERANERKKERQEEQRLQREKELIAAAPKKIADTLSKNGFNDNGVTYVVLGNTYDIKNELKDHGFKFDKVLKWHGPAPRGYNCIEVTRDEVFQFNELGDVSYVTGAADLVQERIDELSADKNSEWVAAEGDKLQDYLVTLVEILEFENEYGYSQCVKFIDENGNHLSWFTRVVIKANKGDKVYISGTVKKLDKYKNTKTTVLTRVKIREA